MPDATCPLTVWLQPSPGGPPIRLIFGDLELTPHELKGLHEVRRLMMKDKELHESPVFADDRYTIRFLQGSVCLPFLLYRDQLDYHLVAPCG